jgi:AcrR family transcriptional regulator
VWQRSLIFAKQCKTCSLFVGADDSVGPLKRIEFPVIFRKIGVFCGRTETSASTRKTEYLYHETGKGLLSVLAALCSERIPLFLPLAIAAVFRYNLFANKFVNESVNTMREANHARGAQTRRKILSASAKVFLQKGYAGASSREVAELAGVSNGSPFYLYGNKEGVLLELVRQMFAGQFEMVERMLGAEADPLLVYAVETSLQMHIAECSEQLRELYAAAYTLPSTSEFIYQNTAEKLMRIFGPYLPGATARDFYELDIASASVTRGFMAKPCDLYFTMEAKLRRYLACCFRIYCVPEEVFRPVVDAAVSMKLHAAAEAVVAQTVRQVEEGYETVMAESRSRNVQMEENI